jgi:DNA repair photolyase
MIRRSLEIIRDESDLRVRIQTRFVTPEMDFDIYRTLGSRLILGTSVMSLDPAIQKVYEPKVPPAERRLEMLHRAGENGIAVYVAVAPVPPEADEADLKRTLEAVKAVNPLTVFLEPINRRGKNFTRIAQAAQRVGVKLLPEMESSADQRAYAMRVFGMAEKLAREVGIYERLHLWPDKELGTPAASREVAEPSGPLAWRQRWWKRVSEWPGDNQEADPS